MPAAKAATGRPESAPVKSQAESKVESAKSDDVAARLEAALRGHLETVASAFASTRAAKAEARGEQKAETPAAARSIYAPDGVRMPPATLLDIDPLSHPAWTGGQAQIMDRAGRVSRFQKKFSGFLKEDKK